MRRAELAGLMAVVGCGSVTCVAEESSEPGPIVNGGGPLVYARTILGELGPSRYASMIMGLSTIEVFDVDDLNLSRFVHPNSQCNGFPVAIATGDVTDDGLNDLLVMDPACGNWIASPLVEHAPVTDWESILPPIAVHRNVVVADFDGDSTTEVVLADAGDVVVFRKAGAAWEVHERRFLDLPQANPLISGPLIVPSTFGDSRPGVLFQRGAGRLAFIPLDRDAPSYMLETEVVSQQVTEYLKPFEQFDHLVAIRLEDCDIFAMGVGLFDSRAGVVPRQAQVLRQRSGGFIAETLPMKTNVTTFAAVADVPAGRWVVASIEDREGMDRLELGALSGCGTYETLAVHDVDFDWQTVSAPPYYTEANLDRNAGVDIVIRREADAFQVLHYDGFSVRNYITDEQGSLEKVTIERVHARRDDTAY